MQATSAHTTDKSIGCYGLRLRGLPGAARWLAPAEDTAPVVEIRRRRAVVGSTKIELSDHHASLLLSDSESRVDLDRAAGVAELSLREDYADEALLHPLLSGSCAIFNWWHGRDAFHAGAFEIGGRAWVVIGDKGQGKSTSLGYLATQGISILSDDLVVEDGGDVIPGPAFIDLRPDAAEYLQQGRDMGRLGARPRFRLDVPVAPTRTPLAGWITLAWGDRVALNPVPVERRLGQLFENRAVRLQPAAPAAFTGYAGLPFFELTRPKQWSSLADVHDLLLNELSEGAEPTS